MTVENVPRVHLATLPTPLVAAPRLSEDLGVEVWLKRDDLTGFGLGGNKVRALDYHIGAALAADADVVVTGGGPQSNWVMLAARSAISRGMRAHVVYYGNPVPVTGNLRHVMGLSGVDVTFTEDPDRSSVDSTLGQLRSDLINKGRVPYVVGRGGASGVGALGYVDAVTELDSQVADAGIEPYELWLAAGSCGTLAGLVAGRTIGGQSRLIAGVTVSRPVDECIARVEEIGAEALGILDRSPSLERVSWKVVGGYNDSYGKETPAGAEAAELVSRTEGVFLDPVFGAKAMAGLISSVREGRVRGPIVFLVSGGAPTFYA